MVMYILELFWAERERCEGAWNTQTETFLKGCGMRTLVSVDSTATRTGIRIPENFVTILWKVLGNLFGPMVVVMRATGCLIKLRVLGALTSPGRGVRVRGRLLMANKKHTEHGGDFAKVVYNNGDKFQGQFRRGKRTGKGTLITREGLVQKGEFIDGVFQG